MARMAQGERPESDVRHALPAAAVAAIFLAVCVIMLVAVGHGAEMPPSGVAAEAEEPSILAAVLTASIAMLLSGSAGRLRRWARRR